MKQTGSSSPAYLSPQASVPVSPANTPACPGVAPGTAGAAPVAAPAAAPEAALAASRSEKPAADAPASYGFLYTPEGMQIMDELLDIASRTNGPRAALEKAEQLLKTSRHFLDACHPLLHRFGRALYFQAGGQGLPSALRQLIPFDQDASQLATSLATKNDATGHAQPGQTVERRAIGLLMTCNAAYLHGAIELFLHTAGVAGNIEPAISFVSTHICDRLGKDFRPPWECYHGIGHGAVQFRRHVNTRASLSSALDLLEKTLGRHHGTGWNGLWMDHFASTTFSSFDVDDAAATLSVCVDLDAGNGRSSGDCFMYSPTAFLLHRPRAYKNALKWCRKGCQGRSGCRGACISGVGMQTFKENLDSMRLVQEVCNAAGKDHSHGCMSGAMGYHTFAFGTRVPKALCEPMKEDALKRICIR